MRVESATDSEKKLQVKQAAAGFGEKGGGFQSEYR